jgi:hypothetical protein
MSGAHVAAHYAAEQKKQHNLEEEAMTRYTPEDLNGDWEFKIIRSITSAFKRPDVLQDVLEEERLGGWELVEKFDDGRLRLKRPKSARQDDPMLPAGYDPYRTQYGISEGGLALWIVVSVGVAIAQVMGTVFLITGSL